MTRLIRQICVQFGPVFQRGSLSKIIPQVRDGMRIKLIRRITADIFLHWTIGTLPRKTRTLVTFNILYFINQHEIKTLYHQGIGITLESLKLDKITIDFMLPISSIWLNLSKIKF